MKITAETLREHLLEFAQKNAPVRKINDKNPKRPRKRAVGKKGTNMYSPYPGNLRDNGLYAIENGIRFDYDKVGYIGYANKYSHKPRYIEKTVDDFCQYCVSLGGRIIRR